MADQGTPPALLTAFILETANRLITVVVQVRAAAGRRGRGGNGAAHPGARPRRRAGVTLAMVRKVRMLCWTAVGMVLFFKRGLTARGVLRDADLTAGS